MAAFDTTRPQFAPTGIAGHVGQVFVSAFGAFGAWNDARATRNELSKLSDHELDDLGLSRGDIAEVARRR